MAQATLDPSVVDAQPEEAMGDTDELLSKLAGEEIDHLLAEAEAGRTAAPPAPEVKPEEPPPAPVVTQEDKTAAQLDELLEGMEGVAFEPREKTEAPPAAEAPVEPPPAPQAQTPPPVSEEARLEVLAAELQVDQPGAAAVSELEAKNPPPPPTPASQPRSAPIDDHIPLMLWPLIAINAPFASCPKSVRRLLGKVAIVTLLNAVGVIVYVTVLKKHH